MRISITRAAMAQVRKDLAGLRDSEAGVVIFRGPANADLKRGPRGEALWSTKPSAPWQARVFALADWPLLQRTEVNGITFVLFAGESYASTAFRVSVRQGALYASAAA